MDFTSQHNSLISSHPASLFIGNSQALLEHIIIELQKELCPSNGCSVCFTCRKIQEQQHESIVWLCPEKQYAIDDLKIIFSTISFAQDEGNHFFFVLQKADMLTSTCANALLKSLEEPPAGYHFILLAQRDEMILPTIKSRCIVQTVQSAKENEPQATLLPFFMSTGFHDPAAFSKELESCNPSEWESIALLDQLMLAWSDNYKKSIIAHDEKKEKQAEQVLSHLKKAMMQPPMPGSSKLFWKNLFLNIKQL